jgi:hypothetical protein
MAKISMIRGTTRVYEIPVTDSNKQPYALKEGEKLVFGVKETCKHPLCVLTKIIEPDENGRCILRLAPEDTAQMHPASYVYDVGLLSGDDYFNIIEPDVFELLSNVTSKEDAQ